MTKGGGGSQSKISIASWATLNQSQRRASWALITLSAGPVQQTNAGTAFAAVNNRKKKAVFPQRKLSTNLMLTVQETKQQQQQKHAMIMRLYCELLKW